MAHQQSDDKALLIIQKITPYYDKPMSRSLRSLHERLEKLVHDVRRYRHDPSRLIRKLAFFFNPRIYPLMKEWFIEGLGKELGNNTIPWADRDALCAMAQSILKPENQTFKSCSLLKYFKQKHKNEWCQDKWAMKKTRKTMGPNRKSYYDLLNNAEFVEHCFQNRSNPENPAWSNFFEDWMEYNAGGALAWLGIYYMQRQSYGPKEAWTSLLQIEQSFLTFKAIDPSLTLYTYYKNTSETIAQETILWMS